VKKFVLLHYGFEKPTPEIMAAWGKWFESMKDNITDMGAISAVAGKFRKPGPRTCSWDLNPSPASRS